MNNNTKDILVLGVNLALKFTQILTHGSRYTCPTKKVNDELFFKFKGEWHSVAQYSNEYTCISN